MSAPLPGRHRGRPAPTPARASPHAQALRAAGLNVTSARLAVLRLAPALIDAHGHLTVQALHAAATTQGYAVTMTALYQVATRLCQAGLLPAQALRLAPRHRRAPPR